MTRNNSCHRLVALAVLYLFSSLQPVVADNVSDLTEMSLESLMDVEVTSVAKQKRKLSESAAAIHVISREDIRRSGATNLAEALRLAPGMQVARINGSAWAVSARGFNSIISNKLLVLIDGRSVYNPVFSGVHWGQQDVVLADIDRIEVIRGPGGTLWGANAVNGVINIITRPAAETQGGLAEIGGGDPLGGFGTLRYGGKLGETAHYRAYGKHTERGALETASGASAGDDGFQSQIGGRIDWQPTPDDAVTLQGDAFTGEFGQRIASATLTPPGNPVIRDTGDKHGANVMLRWRHIHADTNKSTLQIYYDGYMRDSIISGEEVDSWDVDFQHQTGWGEHLDILWGLGYRRSDIEMPPRPNLQRGTRSQGLDTFSTFLQGDLNFTERLRLTLGSKFEHNDFTGFEYQPSARLLWNAATDHTLWAAISRAVRTPNLNEDGFRTNLFVTPGAPPSLFASRGNSSVESEELLAYEFGYRGRLRHGLSIDLTAFYNEYDHLLTNKLDTSPSFQPGPPPHLLFLLDYDNQAFGETYGLEAVAEWQPLQRWRLVASYSLLEMDIEQKVPTLGINTPAAIEGGNPEQQVQLRSYLDLPYNIEFDTTLYWVDQLPAQNVDDYLRADFHLGWKPSPDLSLGLFVQNAFDDRHREFNEALFTSSRIPRTIFGRIRLSW